MATATLIRPLSGFTGEAALYRLDAPTTYERTNDEGEYVEFSTDHVVVSATVAMFTGSETYIFPADESGEVLSWLELDGSFRGGLDHEEALRRAGHSVEAQA